MSFWRNENRRTSASRTSETETIGTTSEIATETAETEKIHANGRGPETDTGIVEIIEKRTGTSVTVRERPKSRIATRGIAVDRANESIVRAPPTALISELGMMISRINDDDD